jgi:hypothetical protein
MDNVCLSFVYSLLCHEALWGMNIKLCMFLTSTQKKVGGLVKPVYFSRSLLEGPNNYTKSVIEISVASPATNRAVITWSSG